MTALTNADAYNYARQAGFDPTSAVIVVAIGHAESGLRPDAIGDTSLENSTWGPSMGWLQIRSLKNPTGHPERDGAHLLDPLYNAKAAYVISGEGSNFNPWTTFKNGDFKKFIDASVTTSYLDKGAITDSDVDQAVGNAVGDAIGGALGLTGWQGDVTRIGLTLVGVGLAVALVVVGATRAVGKEPAAA